VRQRDEGLAAYHQGRYAEAVVYFNRAEEAGQDGLAFARGRAYLRLGEQDRRYFSLAYEDFRRADGQDPDGRAAACMGYCLARLDQPRAAVKEFQRAVDAGYAPAAVWNDLGNCFLATGPPQEARRCLDRAVALAPDLQAARHNRARLDLQLALQAWLKAAGAPTDPEAARVLDACLQEGRADVQYVTRHGTPGPELYVDAARLYVLDARRGGQSVEPALEYLKQAVEAGYDPQLLKEDRRLDLLAGHPRFQELLGRPRPDHPPPPAPRLVDPVPDA
jgi:tetratricopeptide (TPR) repeat protein